MPFSVMLGGIVFFNKPENKFGAYIWRIYLCLMSSKKRKLRVYKAYDDIYELAKNKADLTDKPLATRIEDFVFKYAGVEKTHYFAAMGGLLKSSNKKKK